MYYPLHVARAGETEARDEVPDRDVLTDDAIEDLLDEVGELAAHLHAGTRRLLELVARVDRLGAWRRGGHRSLAHWLSCRTGFDLGTARQYVGVARALEELPETAAAMARGALSFSQARALARVAKPETESDLLALAEGCTVTHLERLVRGWKTDSRKEEAARERELHRSRQLSIFPDGHGMYVVNGLVDPEVGVALQRAVEAASDELYRVRRRLERSDEPAADAAGESTGGPASASTARPVEWTGEGPRDTRREAARRRADALGLLAEHGLATGLGAGRGAGPRAPDGTATATDAEDGAVDGAEDGGSGRSACTCTCGHGSGAAATAAPGPPISGTRAGRYQVVLHVDADTLAEDGEPGRSELEDGTRLSAGTARRLACDASVVRVTHERREPSDGASGTASTGSNPLRDAPILGVGRRTRTIPPALRRALDARDRGCRFPGCGLRFTEAHHVVHWADGGETSLSNTLLLCRHHHRLVHEDGWRVEWRGTGEPAFHDPRGTVHMAGRKRAPPELGDRPVEALARQNRRAGAAPDPWTAGARWKRERDIPDEVYFRALEAGG